MAIGVLPYSDPSSSSVVDSRYVYEISIAIGGVVAYISYFVHMISIAFSSSHRTKYWPRPHQHLSYAVPTLTAVGILTELQSMHRLCDIDYQRKSA